MSSFRPNNNSSTRLPYGIREAQVWRHLHRTRKPGGGRHAWDMPIPRWEKHLPPRETRTAPTSCKQRARTAGGNVGLRADVRNWSVRFRPSGSVPARWLEMQKGQFTYLLALAQTRPCQRQCCSRCRPFCSGRLLSLSRLLPDLCRHRTVIHSRRERFLFFGVVVVVPHCTLYFLFAQNLTTGMQQTSADAPCSSCHNFTF